MSDTPERDACPGCRSLTRTWRDKLWNDDRATWIDCESPWHNVEAGGRAKPFGLADAGLPQGVADSGKSGAPGPSASTPPEDVLARWFEGDAYTSRADALAALTQLTEERDENARHYQLVSDQLDEAVARAERSEEAMDEVMRQSVLLHAAEARADRAEAALRGLYNVCAYNTVLHLADVRMVDVRAALEGTTYREVVGDILLDHPNRSDGGQDD